MQLLGRRDADDGGAASPELLGDVTDREQYAIVLCPTLSASTSVSYGLRRGRRRWRRINVHRSREQGLEVLL